MAEMLRHPVNAHSASKRLDRVEVAKVVKTERHARRGSSNGLCEGRRYRRPRPFRRWEDQIANLFQPGDMCKRGGRQRYDPAPISFALDNLERSGRTR